MNSIQTRPDVSLPSVQSIHCAPLRYPRFRVAAAMGIACFSSLLLHPSVALAEPTTLQSFLKIDGIAGESKTEGHKGEIDAIGFTSGVELVANVGGGGGFGKPQFFEINVAKNVDKASPLLFLNCVVAKNLPTVTLTVAKVNASDVTEYFKIVLTNSVITKVETGGASPNGGALTEQVALSFKKIQWTVTTYNSKGAPIVTSGGYDIAAGKTF